MEPWQITLIVAAGVIILLFFFAQYQQKNACESLTSEELKKCMRKGQLVDVRSKNEFKTGHINGARNIPVHTIGREYKKIRKDQPVYLYCASGKRSKRAAVLLKSKGYTDVYDLAGGLSGWDGPLK